MNIEETGVTGYYMAVYSVVYRIKRLIIISKCSQVFLFYKMSFAE